MKEVSQAYKDCMAAPFRNPTLVEVNFGNYDTTADRDSTWSDNGKEPYSTAEYLSFEHTYNGPYATLELSRWLLDGTFDIVGTNGSNAIFTANKLSDTNGLFTTKSVVECSFNREHTFPGLTFIFDSKNTHEWPLEVTVDYLLSGVVQESITAAITANKAVVDKPIEACDAIRITFNKMLPSRRPRLERVLFGVGITFTVNDIVSTRQKHDVDPLSRRLPNETFSATIVDKDQRYNQDNPQGIWRFIDQHAPISVRFGQILDSGATEWLSEDQYILNGRPSTKKNQAIFTATGLLSAPSGNYYKSKLGAKNLYDMAVDVLNDMFGEEPFSMTLDPSLRSITTTGVLPIAPHAECLQLIAHAACCKLFTDDSNGIHIEPFELDKLVPSNFSVDFTTIENNSQQSVKIAPLHQVEVVQYSVISDSNSKELLRVVTNKTTVHHEFDSIVDNVQVSVSGGSLISYSVYGRAIDITLSSGTKTVVVNGKSMSEKAVSTIYPVAKSGEDDIESNPLITSETMSDKLAQHTISYLSLRSTYDAKYRGNPELETGDVINLQTQFTQNQKALVLVDSINYNGALSGSVKVKSLDM